MRLLHYGAMNPKSIVAIVLAGTVCLVLSTSIISAMFYPPGTVTETFRLKIFELLIYILGIVSGWLLGRGSEPPPPTTPPKA
jgi:hypothetical protein